MVKKENTVSQRTKEALAKRRSEGMKLGRPTGSVSGATKLDNKEKEIENWIQKGLGYSAISRLLDCHRITVSNFCIKRGLTEKKVLSKEAELQASVTSKNAETDLSSSIEMYANGMSLAELANHFSLSYNLFTARLRREGLYDQILYINKKRRTEHSPKKSRFYG